MPFLTSAVYRLAPPDERCSIQRLGKVRDLVRPKPLEQRSGRPLDRRQAPCPSKGMAGATGNVYVGLHEFMG